jgi:nucleotide-binding universal stress UspA family protein
MLKKILAPLDGSEVSECALSYTKALARMQPSAEVVLLTVLEPITPQLDEAINQNAAREIGEEWQKMKKQMVTKAENYLAGEKDKLSRAGIKAKTIVIESGGERGVADIILDYAEQNQQELIVMSTHGRSGISRWAMGSVADKIVHRAKTPVLTITPAGCRL